MIKILSDNNIERALRIRDLTTDKGVLAEFRLVAKEAQRDTIRQVLKLMNDMNMLCPESDECSACEEFRQELQSEVKSRRK